MSGDRPAWTLDFRGTVWPAPVRHSISDRVRPPKADHRRTCGRVVTGSPRASCPQWVLRATDSRDTRTRCSRYRRRRGRTGALRTPCSRCTPASVRRVWSSPAGCGHCVTDAGHVPRGPGVVRSPVRRPRRRRSRGRLSPVPGQLRPVPVVVSRVVVGPGLVPDIQSLAHSE